MQRSNQRCCGWWVAAGTGLTVPPSMCSGMSPSGACSVAVLPSPLRWAGRQAGAPSWAASTLRQCYSPVGRPRTPLRLHAVAARSHLGAHQQAHPATTTPPSSHRLCQVPGGKYASTESAPCCSTGLTSSASPTMNCLREGGGEGGASGSIRGWIFHESFLGQRAMRPAQPKTPGTKTGRLSPHMACAGRAVPAPRAPVVPVGARVCREVEPQRAHHRGAAGVGGPEG